MAGKTKIDSFKLYNPYTLAWGEEISFPSSRNVMEFGNRVYNRYPARSIFLVPRAILAQQTNGNLNVLDPFMGSGTTAVETVISGNCPYGLEMDPFARMVAEVSSTIFPIDDIKRLPDISKNILESWNNYPASLTPNLTGIERWFKDGDLQHLLQLKDAIQAIVPDRLLPFFMVTFADAIKPVSLMERQSLKPYISTKHPKETKGVIESFIYSFEAHLKAMEEMSSTGKPFQTINWLGNNATEFSADSIIDIAISSPPYINALDYTRCIKVESALCGTIDNTIANELRKLQVGHEQRRKQCIDPFVTQLFKSYYDGIAEKDQQRADTCLAYFNDINKNLICVHKALKQNGEYHVIIGDNTIKGIEVPTHEIIRQLALNIGYQSFGYYKYKIKDHRTSLPRNKETSKIEYEHVIMLRKI